MVPVGGAQVQFLWGAVEVMAHSHLLSPSGKHEPVGANHSPPAPPPGAELSSYPPSSLVIPQPSPPLPGPQLPAHTLPFPQDLLWTGLGPVLCGLSLCAQDKVLAPSVAQEPVTLQELGTQTGNLGFSHRERAELMPQ